MQAKNMTAWQIAQYRGQTEVATLLEELERAAFTKKTASEIHGDRIY
jgi:hypothetical protein